MDRRTFLALGLAGTAGHRLAAWTLAARHASRDSSRQPSAFSVIPVVSDGRWIWNKPPEGQTGYLEPRSYQLNVGIELVGRGEAGNLVATTTLPSACPEQTIENEQLQTNGCAAEVRPVGEYARQLVLRAPQLAAGQRVAAAVQCVVTVSKQYHGYIREMFPQRQTIPADVRRKYLGDSPGIQARIAELRALHKELSEAISHPWELAKRFSQWIPRNIRPKIGRFTSVQKALVDRLGDCEEMSAVFVALCRASNIPARLVWVPNHNWAEFFLQDESGHGHWIPAHLVCYSWFGWTGAHEIVLQKGDRLQVPERRGYFRLLEDWMQWQGKRPVVRYRGELVPQAASPGADPGPGSRRKNETGEWQVIGDHPLNHYVRR